MTLQRVVQVQGLDKVFAHLAQLRGEKLSKTASAAMKKGLKKTYVPALKAVAPVSASNKEHRPGTLRNAIDVRAARKRPGEMFALRVGTAGKSGANKAWWAHMVTGGTKPHLITPGGLAGGSFSGFVRRANRGNALALTVAGTLVGVVHHPGARPNNYMRKVVGKEGELTQQITRDLIAAAHA